jgi:hypothetical protein
MTQGLLCGGEKKLIIRKIVLEGVAFLRNPRPLKKAIDVVTEVKR